MKRIALTTVLGLTLLSSCQNNKAPDAQALLGIAQQAHPTVPYCTEINPYGPYIIGHTLQVSHNDRKVDPRFAQLEGTKLITISPPPAGYDPNSLDDYTETVTPSETMLSIAKNVMQPGGKVICRGDLKLTEVTEVTKPQNGVIQARGPLHLHAESLEYASNRRTLPLPRQTGDGASAHVPADAGQLVETRRKPVNKARK